MYYQKLILLGIVDEGAHRYTAKNSGMPFTAFTVAVNDYKDRTTLFSVVAFGKLSEITESHVTKGRQVFVEGRIDVHESGGFDVIADRVVYSGPAGTLE